MRDWAWCCGIGLFAQELRSHSRAVAALPVFGHSFCGSASYARLELGVAGWFVRARVALPQKPPQKHSQKHLTNHPQRHPQTHQQTTQP